MHNHNREGQNQENRQRRGHHRHARKHGIDLKRKFDFNVCFPSHRLPPNPSPDQLPSLNQKVAPAACLSPYRRGNVSLRTIPTLDCPDWPVLMLKEVQPNLGLATTRTYENRCPKRVALANDVHRPIIHAIRFFQHAGNLVNRLEPASNRPEKFLKHAGPPRRYYN